MNDYGLYNYASSPTMAKVARSVPREKRTWGERLRDYTEETTLHGLKYLAAEGGLTTRKLAWIIVVVTASAVMTYFIVAQLLYFYQRSTMTDIDVDYETRMTFPAVVVCNQNPLRIVPIFKEGMYDAVTEAYRLKYNLPYNVAGTESCAENFLLLDEICSVSQDKVNFYLALTEVSRAACEHTCSHLESEKCSGYLYNSDFRNCTLTSFIGDIEIETMHGFCEGSRSLFFRRLRCLEIQSFACTFEGTDCPLKPSKESPEQWSEVTGKDSSIAGAVDHTLATKDGHFLALLPTNRRENAAAVHQTPFIDTTGKCFMLFYKHLSSGTSTLEMSATGESLAETRILVKTGSNSSEWQPLFGRLPDGIQMLVIKGIRRSGFGGIAVDDIRVLPCAEFEEECVFSFTGSEYMGKVSRSASGKPCLPWLSLARYIKPWADMFADGSAEKSRNFCRNVDVRNDGPWCFTSEDEQERCDIPYCECPNLLGKCESSGRCLPKEAICDGELHCDDGSDEKKPCESLMHLECDFEDRFLCGYERHPSDGFYWKWSADHTWSDQMHMANVAINLKNDFSMKVVHGANSRPGDVAYLMSKEFFFSTWSLLSFHVKMKVSPDDSSSKLHVHLMNSLGTVSGTILSVKKRTDSVWVKYYVSVPPGIHTILFEAVHGWTHSAEIALDSIAVVDGVVKRPNEEEIYLAYDSLDYGDDYSDDDDLSGDESSIQEADQFLNISNEFSIAAVYKVHNISGLDTGTKTVNTISCSFSPTENCTSLYITRPESLLYEWAIMPKEFLNYKEGAPAYKHQACGGDYYEASGYIESPGYPVAYGPNLFCNYTVHQPSGSEMTINFAQFHLETSDDCSNDALMIGQTRYCGKSKQGKGVRRPTLNRNEQLNLVLKTDASIQKKGFRMTYTTTSVDFVDYIIAAGFHMDFTSREYRSRLSSPAFQLQETHCLVFEAFVSTKFEVLLVHRLEKERPRRLLWRTEGHLGAAWHNVALTIVIGEEEAGRMMHILFDSYHHGPPIYAAALDNIRVVPGRCEDNQVAGDNIIDCDFSDINQCGYVDSSTGPLRWTRAQESAENETERYSMMCWFSDKAANPARLLTPSISVAGQKCLHLAIFEHGNLITMSVGKLNRDGAMEKFIVVNKQDLSNKTEVTVELPNGTYRIILEALGKNSLVRLDRVWTRNETCISSGNAPLRHNDDLNIIEQTTRPSTESTVTRPRHPVSNLPPEEIREKAFRRMLQLIDMPLTDFLKRSTKTDDLLLQCSWQDKPCRPEFLHTAYTDDGYCLFFNANESNSLTVTHAGADYGVRMMLDIGEYNALKGLTSESGIKVQVFPQTTSPNLKNKGFVVGPGMHAFTTFSLTKARSLPSPYGNCGERYLPHFPDSKYSRLACQQDCEAHKLERRCGCRDTYMPDALGYPLCDTRAYLECAIRTEETSNASVCGHCPAECHTEDYNFDLSYSAVSSIGVDTLLGHHRDRIFQELFNAANTRDRSETTRMGTTLKYIKNIHAVLDEAQRVLSVDVLDEEVSVFSRVQKGIQGIVHAARSDIQEVLFHNLSAQIDTFNKLVLPDMKFIDSALDKSVESFSHMKHALKWSQTDDPGIRKFLEASTEAGISSLTTIGAYAVYLKMNNVTPFSVKASRAGMADALLPVYLVRGKDPRVKCSSYIDALKDAGNLIGESFRELRTLPFEQFIDTDSGTLNEQIDKFEKVTQSLKKCTSEYGNHLGSIESWLNRFPSANASRMINADLLPAHSTTDIQDYVDFVERVYELYKSNKVTKSELASYFTDGQKQSLIVNVDSLRIQIQQQLSNPMKNELRSIATALESYYIAGLKQLGELATYYDIYSRTLTDRAQNLMLWKIPHASLDNPKVLSYILEGEEPNIPVYINDQLNEETKKDIHDYLAYYVEGLVEPIERLDKSLVTIIERLQEVYDHITRNLNDYREATELGESFVMNNIIKLDLYFSDLKVSTLEQKKEYDLGAFFGDMGGYMGLLLGASVLTFIELLDLFLDYIVGRYFHKVPNPDLEYTKDEPKVTTPITEGRNNPLFQTSTADPNGVSVTKV